MLFKGEGFIHLVLMGPIPHLSRPPLGGVYNILLLPREKYRTIFAMYQ